MTVFLSRMVIVRDWKENGEKANGHDQGKGIDIWSICVIHIEKHDL